MVGTFDQINEFLQQKEIALIGLSRDPKHFSRTIYRELIRRGYKVFPVNPHLREIDNKISFPSVKDIPGLVSAALLLTPPHQTEAILHECLQKQVSRIWIVNDEGLKRVAPKTMEMCKHNRVQLISGYCPFMFLPNTGFFHRFHGWISRLTGSYPN